jgi:hypothetical protein
LPKPWELIAQISKVSPAIFIWTHYALESQATETVNGHRGLVYKEHGLADPLSGLSAFSFWPTLDALYLMLRSFDFRHFCVLENDPTHIHGPSVTFAATSQSLGRLQQLHWAMLRWRWWFIGWCSRLVWRYGRGVRWLMAGHR